MTWLVADDVERDAVRELHAAPDRVAGIVASSILDGALKRFLEGFLMDAQKSGGATVLQDMFRSTGPLGSFSAKIDLALMIGAASEMAWRDWHSIRAIRNAFAHDLRAGSFEIDSIRLRCMSINGFAPHIFERGTPEADTPQLRYKMFEMGAAAALAQPRTRFLLCIRFYLLALRFVPLPVPKRGLFPSPVC